MGRPTKADLQRFEKEELTALESVVRAARRATKLDAGGNEIDWLLRALNRLDRWRRIHK